ncbi:dihydrolipoamide acetyltransferase family protein [Sedimenticola selenatireducens]|uniref:Dihydrolipoamide acetyltransferase component of pyruvate dehydrogenase complex n=1 Tax=Sedimenticola selenatireducens TaxID=191960 RepID=A0A558DVK2_9GAMM|nr:dihydrolipoamide acetyltransferase family protein [Sedimenticola selenatireducens]TVO77703.1 2-oxo acid dehydrogenase subunit E2 [Sedimenticola selenatireducens]TVT65009.1 MAG: 2-oxo acid dehydrogenase subunit E2 [Sedimenticola selenatireducens]
MKLFNLPDLGEGLQEAEIVSWQVKPGDEVTQGQLLLSVETAKAIVEIPSPEAGIITKTFGDDGDIIQVGDPLVEFKVEGATESPTSPIKPVKQDSGTVVGEVKSGSQVIEEKAARLGVNQSSGAKATPAVRALAKQLDVDLSIVTPTGPKDTITAGDVQRVAKILAEVGPMELLRGVRRAMARSMAQAHAEVVPVTLCDVVDIQHWKTDEDFTVRLIQAILAACEAEPSLNAWYDAHAVGRRLLKKVHLGIAVDTTDGLFVPVISDVGQYSTAQLRIRLNDLKKSVSDRSIPADQLRGNTFTLSNFGTIAGRHANPIVIPPTVAILGAGLCYDAVVPVDGKPAVHRLLPLSLTFDHRAVTGGEAGRFLAALIKELGDK